MPLSFAASRATEPAAEFAVPGHWTFSKDAPIQLSIIDTEEQIGRLIPFLDNMV